MPTISSGSAPRCIGAASFILSMNPLSSSKAAVSGVRTHPDAAFLLGVDHEVQNATKPRVTGELQEGYESAGAGGFVVWRAQSEVVRKSTIHQMDEAHVVVQRVMSNPPRFLITPRRHFGGRRIGGRPGRELVSALPARIVDQRERRERERHGRRGSDGSCQREAREVRAQQVEMILRSSRPVCARSAAGVTAAAEQSGSRAAAQSPAISSTASANASGASCGRLWPMPPCMRRCVYGPENLPA